MITFFGKMTPGKKITAIQNKTVKNATWWMDI